MAEIVAAGVYHISTDGIIIPADTPIQCPAIDDLQSVGSGLTEEVNADAVFIARERLYALLVRPENLASRRALASNDRWAVVRVARHATAENETEFAETVLACLEAGRDVAPIRDKTRLVTPTEAVRRDLEINTSLSEPRRTRWSREGKRRLADRDVNIFTSSSPTHPYKSLGKLEAAEHQRLVRNGKARKRRKRRSPRLLRDVIGLIREGRGVREITRLTGVPKSTVSDMRRVLREKEQERPNV
jgi:hypothetical protein